MTAHPLLLSLAELPYREVYWNVIHPHLKVYIPFAIALAVFVCGVVRRVRMWRMGAPAVRTDAPVARGWKMALDTFTQRLVLREIAPGVGHALLFFGFVVLFIGTLIVMAEADFGLTTIGTPSIFYAVYTVVLNLFGLLAIAGVLVLAARRYLQRPAALDNRAEDWISLLLLLVILVTGHVIQALRLAVEQPPWAHLSFASNWLVPLFAGRDAATLRTAHEWLWWIHMVLVMGWVAWMPYSKLWHIFSGMTNLFFRARAPRARIEKDAAVAAMMAGEDIDDDTVFGVSRLEDLRWTNLLDADACIRCGRCQENCPAHLTDKALNPKTLVQDVKSHMEEVWKKGGAGEEGGGRRAFHGDVIAPEVLWACTTCRACEENCPMGIEHLDTIVGMRQYLTQMEATFPEELHNVFRGMETNSNPLQIGLDKRFDWAEGMDLKTLAEDPDHEILFYVGCAGSFDDRGIPTTKAMIRIMRAAGVKFGLLGVEEGCCGETARRLGNEYLAHALIRQNIETFDRYKVTRIVTACPHGYNTLKHEYPDFGGRYEVLHHTEFIAELIRAGRLRLDGACPEKVAFHDSCYLGRYNDLYDAPREIVRSIRGLDLVEADRHGRKSFCCGAGGGLMWIEESEGRRVNVERTDQLLDTGARSIAVACPYCRIMLDDGLRDEDLNKARGAGEEGDLTETRRVVDVAQLVAERIKE